MDLMQVWCRTKSINLWDWEAVSSKWLQVQTQAKPHLSFQKHPSLWHESKELRQKAVLDIFPGIQVQRQCYEDHVLLVGSPCCQHLKMFLWWWAQAPSPTDLRAFPVLFRLCCSAVSDVSQATLAMWNIKQDNYPPQHLAATRSCVRKSCLSNWDPHPPVRSARPAGKAVQSSAGSNHQHWGGYFLGPLTPSLCSIQASRKQLIFILFFKLFKLLKATPYQRATEVNPRTKTEVVERQALWASSHVLVSLGSCSPSWIMFSVQSASGFGRE